MRKFIFAQHIKKVSYRMHNVIPIQTYDFFVNLFFYHQNKEINLQILYCIRCRATIRLNDLFVFFKYCVSFTTACILFHFTLRYNYSFDNSKIICCWNVHQNVLHVENFIEMLLHYLSQNKTKHHMEKSVINQKSTYS